MIPLITLVLPFMIQQPPPVQSGLIVTFSHQPLESFRAAIGEKLQSLAAYSALVCNNGSSSVTVSGGSIQQAAEMQAHLNVVAPVLVAPTGQRAKAKTKKSKFLTALKWGAVAAGIIISAKVPHVGSGVIQGVTIGAGALQVLESTLASQDAAAQQTLTNTLSQVLDPMGQLAVAAKSCALKLLFAVYVPGFKPVSAVLSVQ